MSMSYRLIIIVGLLLLNFQNASALQIIAPKEGEIVYAGSDLTIIVKPDAGESFKAVATMSYESLIYNFSTNDYRIKIKVPQHLIGVVDDLIIIAVDMAGNEIELRRTVFVKLPVNVILQSIEVYPDFIVLEKLPPESNPDDIKAFGARKFSITGMYSDGIRRKLTSGTTYTSSNDKVVKVSPEGEVTAQGLGEAKITVRNGKFSVDVKVIVDPYKE